MSGILIDTNVLVDWLKSKRSSRPKNEEQKQNSYSAVSLIQTLIDSDTEIYISCHTIKELLQYPHISPQEEERILTLFPKFCTILSTDLDVAKIAGILSRNSQEYRLHHIEDCYIAATAISHELPLFTRNPKDFKYVSEMTDFNLILKVPYDYQTNL